MKIDFHTHTAPASPDALHSLSQLARRAKAVGLDALGVCEHNKFCTDSFKLDGLLIMRGMECSAKEGHMAVYGVGEKFDFEKGMPAAQVARNARKAGGVSIVTHPFSVRKRHVSMGSMCFKVGATAIERYNGSDFVHNIMAKVRVPTGTGGSDAHSWYEVGNAYTEIECRPREDEILEAVKHGAIKAVLSQNPFAIARRKWERFLVKRTDKKTGRGR